MEQDNYKFRLNLTNQKFIRNQKIYRIDVNKWKINFGLMIKIRLINLPTLLRRMLQQIFDNINFNLNSEEF